MTDKEEQTECMHCGAFIDKTKAQTREVEGCYLDDQWNDIPCVRHEIICPDCNSWMEE